MNRFTNSSIRLFHHFLNIVFWMTVNFLAKDQGSGIFFIGLVTFELFFTIFMGSVKDAIKKMVAARNYKGFHGNAKQIFRYALIYAAAISVFLFLVCEAIGASMLRDITGHTLPQNILLIFGLYFLLKAFTEVISGYYMGMKNEISCALSEIVYSIVLVASAPFLIKKSMSYGVKVAALLKNPLMTYLYGAMGAVAAQCIAALLSLVVLAVGFRNTKIKRNNEFKPIRGVDSRKSFLGNFLKIGFSVFGKKIFPVATVFAIVLIYSFYGIKTGLTEEALYTGLGVYAGKYIIVCAFPIMLFLEYVRLVGHNLNEDYNGEEYKTINHRFAYFLKNATFMLVPVTFMTIVLSKPIVKIFFGGKMNMGIELVKSGFLLILFAGFALVFRTLLRAIKCDMYINIANLSGFLTAILYVTLSAKNSNDIKCLVIALVLNYLVQAGVAGFFAFKFTNIHIMDYIVKAVKVLIATGIMLAVVAIIDKFLILNWITIFIIYAIGILVYVAVLFVLKGINTKDINSLKGTILYAPLKSVSKFFMGEF